MAAAQNYQSSLLSLLLAAFYGIVCVFGQEWRDGRATFFADTWDPWQMSMGHCQYGALAKSKCTGWDVAAVADKNWDFNSATSNCGICYEVKCVNGFITDGYGENFDRNICYNHGQSVVVQVVDLCECNYAPNAYSNRRWCCGDKQHLDLSAFAFEKLGPKIQGVMKIAYRQVSCDTYSGAPDVPNPTQINPNEPQPSTDRRPCPAGTSSGAGGRRKPRNPPPRKSGGGGAASSNVAIGQWSINAWQGRGPTGGTARCGTLLPWGGFTFQNGLQSKRFVDFWIKKESGNLPNMKVIVEGNGGCKRSRHIGGLPKIAYKGEYIRVRVNLRSFGCGGVYKVILQNNIGNWGWQNVCIDNVRSS